MRIIGGQWRGRTLMSPQSSLTRPTLDRVRETLFNILEHNKEFAPIRGSRVLDVFAGTGALGIEALSRGAREATFVEKDREALQVLKANTQGMTAKILAQDVLRLQKAPHPFDLIFMDAPYGQGLTEKALDHLHAQNWMAPSATLVIEIEKKEVFVPPPFLQILKEKTMGPARFLMGSLKSS